MRKLLSILFVLTFCVNSRVLARAPVWKIAVFTAEIDASADEVWNVVKDFGNLSWHPMVVKVDEAKRGNTKGATRKFTLNTGGHVTQKIKKYCPLKRIIRYNTSIKDMTIIETIVFNGQLHQIQAFPVGHNDGLIKVEGLGNEKSKIIWRSSIVRGLWQPAMTRNYKNNLITGELPEFNSETKSYIYKFVKAGMLGVMKKFDNNSTEEDIESCFTRNHRECKISIECDTK